MGKSLRVKDLGETKDEATAVKINEGKEGRKHLNPNEDFTLRKIVADSFTRKNIRLEPKKGRAAPEHKVPAPYIYLRVALTLLIIFIFALSIFYFLRGYELFPILVIIIAMFIPASVLIFFYELDTSKNLSLYNILIIAFVSCGCAIVVELISHTFIGKVGFYGAMAIGLMECGVNFLLLVIFIYMLKVDDPMTAMLIGAVVGASYAIICNVNVSFGAVFVDSQYAPRVEALIFNETLMDSFNNVVRTTLMENLAHAFCRVLMYATIARVMVKCKTNKFKEKIVYFILFAVCIVAWGFASLWIMPFDTIIGSVFRYILQALITAAILLACAGAIKSGMAEINYDK